jgi:hypothetical protein
MDDDYGEGKRKNRDYQICIISNYSNQSYKLSTGLIPIGGFYYFDSIDINLP